MPRALLFTVSLNLFFLFAIGDAAFGQYTGGDFGFDHSRLSQATETGKISQYLQKIQVTGFQETQTNCLAAETADSTRKAVEKIKLIAGLIPPAMQIVVTGHADKSGPEITDPRGGIPGNDFYSARRAHCVARQIIRKVPLLRDRVFAEGHGSTRNRRMVSIDIYLPEDAALERQKFIQKVTLKDDITD